MEVTADPVTVEALAAVGAAGDRVDYLAAHALLDALDATRPVRS